jgi:undecaprenyl-phosphate 4-deoxy-4-formamido-L-arabinose transferase
MILLMVATGAILFALGVIAEYVGMAVNMAMGKPLYLPVRDRAEGPLGRDRG